MIFRFPRKLGYLSPNSRPRHWAQKARAIDAAKAEAKMLAISIPGPRPAFHRCDIEVTIVGSSQVDADNAVACAKAYIDGLAPIVFADDKHIRTAKGSWRPTEWWEKPHIEIRVEGIDGR